MPTYCTLAQVKAALSLPTPHTSADDELESVIEAVSRAIDEACNTQFYAATQTRYYTADCFTHVLTDDLLSVTTLSTDADGDGVYELTWTAADYALYPYNAPLSSAPRPYWRIETKWGGARQFPAFVVRGVQVVGAWGQCQTGAHPKQVEMVATRESVHNFHALRSPWGQGGPGAGDVALPQVGLSRNSLALLAPYRRIAVG